ncbi:MAG: aminotransferase DegT [Rickettsiales bacterium]|nr:aminotransferase DegT [Rickettsiales bacterium]RPG15535.1 MAG: DegT/DnrJ/EryC1/StrS family aminotransferase [Pelagibacteraceae bacterium TMED195]
MINVCEPLISQSAKKYLNECIQTEWISSSGRFLDLFERKWAKYCDAKDGVAVSNGTSALQVAFKSLDLKPGDEVIMPSFTIISCAMAIIEAGGKPILVDCYSDNWCMNIDEVKKKISNKTKAILVVHMFGHPVEMDEILKLVKKNNLFLIEDAAEAHGATYKKKKVGSFGDLACFSFYANKLITTGEGGMVVSNNKKLTEKVRSLRNLAFRNDRRFYHTEIGYNYRLTNMQAAIGISQIENLKKHIKIKRTNTNFYNKILNEMSLPLRLPLEKNNVMSVYWMYGIIIENKTFNAKFLATKLWEQGIETRPLFLGMHQQPIFKKMNLFKNEKYPVTEELAEYGLYLPSGLKLKKKDIIRVCKTVKKIFNENKKK